MASVNIVSFGETGVGKSSVINLIAGRQVANISPDVEGRTLSSQRYTLPVGSRTYHVWDTAGLDQPELGTKPYLAAVEEALALIKQLTEQGGVDLLLFCMRGNRLTATTQSNYRLFYEVLCRQQVPIALVITNLEREVVMDDWWTRNAGSLDGYGIKSVGHACVTGLPSHKHYAQSRVNIDQLLRRYNGQGKYVMPHESWFIEFLRLFGLSASLKRGLKESELKKFLVKRCKLKPNVAQELAGGLFGKV